MITAIVLAAGKSKRFGKSNKLLATYKRNPVLKHTLNKITKSKVDEILLVTGHQNNKIQNQFKKYSNIKFLFNKNFNKGMSSSIKIGLTGTPLLGKDYNSKSLFGDYIHKYYYNASIKDGYTKK